MKVIIDPRPKGAPTPWQEYKRAERKKLIVAHRNERVAQRYRTERNARLAIVEHTLERSLTPGARDAAIQERQRIIDYLK